MSPLGSSSAVAAKRCPPRWEDSQVSQPVASAIAAATGRPRTAQHRSRLPLVHTRATRCGPVAAAAGGTAAARSRPSRSAGRCQEPHGDARGPARCRRWPRPGSSAGRPRTGDGPAGGSAPRGCRWRRPRRPAAARPRPPCGSRPGRIFPTARAPRAAGTGGSAARWPRWARRASGWRRRSTSPASRARRRAAGRTRDRAECWLRAGEQVSSDMAIPVGAWAVGPRRDHTGRSRPGHGLISTPNTLTARPARPGSVGAVR